MLENLSPIKLSVLVNGLPYGSKSILAKRLECDPAKITRALRGLVRSPFFLAKLRTEAKKLEAEFEALAQE